MPTYVYACTACNEEYELEQRITEDAITTCRCGSEGTVKRVIQPVGIAFKGSGFYVNDSVAASKPPSRSEESKKDDAEIPAAKTEETKTTPKTESASVASDSAPSTPAPAGESKPATS